MKDKKTAFQLYLSLILLLGASSTSFSQVLMYCSNNNYSFQHMHNYLYIDADKDGYGSNVKSTSLQCTYRVPSGYSINNTDCNDSNAAITPFTIWYRDADGDTYGNAANTTSACTQPTGYVSNYSDCNDSDGSVAFTSIWYRDADGDGYGTSTNSTSSCNQPSGYVRNSSDYNDGTTNITNIPPQTFYRDADGDGHGNPSLSVYYSVQPSGYVTNNSDCNDTDSSINPNTPWFRDNDSDGYGTGGPIFSCSQPSGYARNTGDCNDYDGSISPTTIWYLDADGDGYGTSSTSAASCSQPSGYVRNSSDYDDTTVNITNIAPSTFYRDADGDGFGSSSVTIYYSVRPSGYVTNSSDCNDSDASLNPNTTWYRDVDGDGYGNSTTTTNSCTQPSGYARTSGDCNDYDNTLNPTTIWYRDADGDGYGTSSTTTTSCSQPSGYVRNSSDYNDATLNITNIAPSTFYRDADGDTFGNLSVSVYYSVLPAGYVTNNTDCNDSDSSLNPTTIWYRDIDGDGYGTPATTTVSCTQPSGYVRNSSDYDDTTVNITNIAPATFYRDADGDGFGSALVTIYYSVRPSGYVTNNTDCNDSDASLNPNTVWYRDADGDGYGTLATSTPSCTQPTGYVRNSSDYNDGTTNITNIAPATFYRDADGDGYGSPSVTVYYSVKPAGYVTNNTDCNDTDSSINPNTPWFKDNDGDGYGAGGPTLSCNQPSGYVRNSSDYNDATPNITNIAPSTFYRDADTDGYGNPSMSVYYSVLPAGYVSNNTDCNDSDASLNPTTVWYQDADGDGYGTSAISTASCTQPSGYVRSSGDLNDSAACITNVPPTTYYADVDGDGFGNPNSTKSCSAKPTAYVANNTDCNDSDASVNPNTIWYRDADGDGFGTSGDKKTSCTQSVGYIRIAGDINDSAVCITNVPPTTYYADLDGDGFGNLTNTISCSTKPTGYVTTDTDCNDSDASLNPTTFWYRDVDGDGFGTSSTTTTSCTQPTGYVRNTSDYDDTTVNITNIAPQTFYRDADGDGFGNASEAVYYSVIPAGYVSNNSDCDDSKNSINPNTKWYADVDGDGLGDAASVVTQCTAPSGKYVLNNTDKCPWVSGSSNDCGGLANPANDKNYIITRVYKLATTTSIDSPSPAQAKVAINYFDGLGRPIQQIANQQSDTGKDIVTHIEYDTFGRQTKDYLPFVGTNRNMTFDSSAQNNTLTFYKTVSFENTTNPFSEKALEASPLNRVLEQAAPGNVWSLNNPEKHTIKLDYQTNTASEVKRFTVTTTWNTTSGLYTTALVNMAGTTFYGANQLYKNVTFDENTAATPTETSGATVEFKNKEGQVVLKRTYDAGVKHDTYYVYDVYGNLTYVIPPKADMALTQTILDELCYQYQYDNRNRLVAKKLPGKQWEFIVYDKLDRVVATGPAFSPFSDVTASGWLITKYDAFNRVVYTGWLNSSATATTRKTMQDAMNTATIISEKKQTSGTIDGITANYTNTVTPTSFKLLTLNFYDDYAFPNIGIAKTIEGQTVATAVKGLATGSWTRIATTTAETKGETYHTLYNYKYRPIRTHYKNYLAGYTYTDSKLDDFTGQVQYTVQRQRRVLTDIEIVVKETFTYSAQDRLLTHTHQINGGAVQLMAENTYDELGQLMSKKVGNSSAAPLQKVDYAYNIRGWMKSINNPAALQQGSDPADLFGFKINYNIVEGSATAANKLYNGNIAETFWSTATDGGFVRNYGYKYDQLNRLKDATYQKSNVVTTMYNENLTYDKNGNIMTLKRNGDRDVQTGTIGIDNLSYIYATNSNKLMSVVDNTNNTSGFNDFNKSGNDYAYDVNGNMTVDKNKKITAITYNHLNLPTKIVFTTGNIVYIYNAAGQKVQKVVTTTTPASVVTTDYLGSYQYRKKTASEPVELQYFPTAEGYVKNTPVSGTNTYSYVFNYTDHLGNTRLSYTKDVATGSLKILEESNYYPFGLKHNGYNPISPAQEYKYKYNGKELQDELGLNFYDYGARNYDAAIGRWMNVDPLAEKYFGASPYNYVLNSPVNAVDPDGMDIYLLTESGRTILALKEKDKKTDTMYAVSNSSITDITSSTGTRESSPSIFDMKDTNGDGQFSKEDGVTVKSGLIGQLGKASNKGDGSYLSTSEYSKENENNYLSLFKYISDNSLENEFSLHFFNENGQNKIQLGTFYENMVSPGASGKTKSYHNHSDTDLVDERMSMGDNGRGRPNYSTQANDFNMANSAQISYPNYVYFGKSHRLYNVTKDNIIYIQKINNSNDLKTKK